MTAKITFDITKPFWPYENVLQQGHRRDKLEKIKKKANKQIKLLKNAVENSNVSLIDKLDNCKANRRKINHLIKAYNTLVPFKTPIIPLDHLCDRKWTSAATLPLCDDIISAIITMINFRDLTSWSSVCKTTWKWFKDDVMRFEMLKIAQIRKFVSDYEYNGLSKKDDDWYDESIEDDDHLKVLRKYIQHIFTLQEEEKLTDDQISTITNKILDVVGQRCSIITQVGCRILLLLFSEKDEFYKEKHEFTERSFMKFSRLGRMDFLYIADKHDYFLPEEVKELLKSLHA